MHFFHDSQLAASCDEGYRDDLTRLNSAHFPCYKGWGLDWTESTGETITKIGLHLPQIGAAARDIADAAVCAEQAGYESIWVSDHLVVPESGGRLPPIEIL